MCGDSVKIRRQKRKQGKGEMPASQCIWACVRLDFPVEDVDVLPVFVVG